MNTNPSRHQKAFENRSQRIFNCINRERLLYKMPQLVFSQQLSGDVSMSLSNVEVADHGQITNDELLRYQGPQEVIQKVTFKETETIVESWTASVLGTNPMKFFKNPILDANTNPFVRMLWRSAIAVGIYIRHKNQDEHNEEELDSKNVFLGLKYDYSEGIDERLQPNPNLREWGWNFPKHPN